MKTTIKLNQVEVKKAIGLGNGDGQYFLAVAPDGTTRLHWYYPPAGRPAPWPKDSTIIGLPSLFPDGEGAEWEMAEECLKDYDILSEGEAICEAEGIGMAEVCERLIPKEWGEYRGDILDWLAEAFLDACNGGTDLNRPAPWGYEHEYGESTGVAKSLPFEFEWE